MTSMGVRINVGQIYPVGEVGRGETEEPIGRIKVKKDLGNDKTEM